jgi:hypothetical protein
MDIKISIDDKRIRELISEAGSRYWARHLEFRGSSMAFTIVEHGGIHDKGSPGETKHTVTTKMIRDGLTKMANAKHDRGGHHFPDVFNSGQSDMYTGDAIIQFAIFGELKHG